MYDIRQFRPTLYALLMLGFLGFAVAAEAPGLWLLATLATALHIWLVNRSLFRPLPRLAANVITLLCAVWLVIRVRHVQGPPILAIGEFLVFLQLVKLYEQRGNRDLAQMLVLSLLLMVAAAISTGSLLFGLLFMLYLLLSLYCCLLFHLKSETDHARAVMGVDENKLNPMVFKQDPRLLPRSMRRLTGFVSVVATLMAVMVFLLFPRGTGAGMIGNLAFKPSQAMTGFSDRSTFQDIAKLKEDHAVAGYASIRKNGKAWGAAGEIVYLRGTVTDHYNAEPGLWEWSRTTGDGAELLNVDAGSDYRLHAFEPDIERYQVEIRLLPHGQRTLFAMPGLLTLRSGQPDKLKLGRDDVIERTEALTGEMSYMVESTNGPVQADVLSQWERRSVIPPAFREVATRDDVAGTDGQGNLALRRQDAAGITDLDRTLAQNFERYLQDNFKYTTDLTDVRRLRDEDPYVHFLTQSKKGHCEYFARAMVLLCQSVGMQARVVKGYKCDEFNTYGGYYVIRRSHAHEWVEVRTPSGWELFDPTSSQLAEQASAGPGFWGRIKQLVEHLEYAWGNNIVNYDAESRTNLITNVDDGLTNTAIQTNNWLQNLRDMLNVENFWFVSSGLLSALMAAMVCTVVAAVLYFLFERMRLRRRAARIGLGQLPSSDQKRLARQLAFYDELLRTLDRRAVARPAHLTPLEFSRSIGYLPGELYAAVHRMTQIFYRVRYGGYELSPQQQRRLLRVVERLDQRLGPAKG